MKNREKSILNNSVFLRETLPGSREEDIVVSELKNLFIEAVDWFKVFETPTLSWFEKECVIETSNRVYKCRALPYTSSFETEGYPVDVIYRDNKLHVSGNRDYSIAFTELPLEVDLVKYIVLELSRFSNIEAVVFYDREPSTYRSCVVTGDWRYSIFTGSPPPIPVLVVTRENYFEIIKNQSKVKLRVRSFINKESCSKTVVMGINGSSDREIHISAHHDHWFTGFSDNLVGLEILYRLAELLKNRSSRYNILLISYSSEELGGLNYASWYWSWGSRYYLKIMSEKNTLDKITTDINIDCIYNYPVEIYSNPALKHCIDKVVGVDVKHSGFDNVDFDSFSYTLFGIPALTITSINTMKNIYHTNRDNGFGFNYELINRVVAVVFELIKCIEEENVKYKPIAEHVISNLDSAAPVELKNLVAKIISLDKLIENEEDRVRFITKNFTNFTYIPGLRHIHYTDILGEFVLLMRIINNLDEYLDEEVVIMNFDKPIISLKITKYSRDEVLDTLRRLITTRTEFYSSVYNREAAKYIYSRKE